MKVVGIDLIKLFRNFKFENRPLFSPAIWRSPATFLVDFDIEKNYVPLKIAFTPDIVVYAG